MTNTFAYTCNPKYIYEELKRREPDRDMIWIVDSKVRAKDYPPDAVTVKLGSLKCLREVYSSSIWIDNGIAFSEHFARRGDQMHIQTMHGSLGIKRIDNAVLSRNKRGFLGRRVVRRESELTDYVITNSAFEEGVFRRVFWKDTPMVRLGHARTDPLFGRGGRPVEAIRGDLERRYGIPPGCRIAPFAPTHRKDLSADDLDFGFKRMITSLEAKFGGKWTLMVRFHSRTKNIRILDAEDGVVNATDYPDMQELMMVADIGITDYSSWIFDYVVTGRPGFIFATDVERYSVATGLCYPLEETPFPVAHNAQELFANVAGFDPQDYSWRVKRFLDKMECVDDGRSAARIADWLTGLEQK
ncbi:MAG: CDP-glycerol glycerophosphotransferase family protein [Kiritimatiellae bacterium]|nr:CDP-glycerol glycerophosphotransferase family protein [Kiritimatiellia bacterium]